ncbi:MAG: GntR family transcriptional regulator [Proteobacteria bacterium]|nr:GntR family transcriptional regulator [Pseudomonadota bacterium]
MRTTLYGEYRKLDHAGGAQRSLAYLRLRRAIQSTIESGSLPPGQTLPSERDLAKKLALSRVTVRKAIGGLVEDGLLTQRHGAGTFVAERIVKSFSRLTGFTDDLRARGLQPRVQFLERGVGEVTPEEAMALNLSPGAEVIRLRRLRFADEKPLAIESTVVPATIIADPDAVKLSLYDELERIGCRPTRALQRLRAVALDATDAAMLDCPSGCAALAIERRAFLDDGRVVEFTQSLYRGDAYDFVAELHGE